MIKTVLKTAPLKMPITIDGDNGMKNHLNLDEDFNTDDIYIETLINAVIDHAEDITGRRLITQSWYYYLMDWPDGDYIDMPFGKLQSVTAIKYKDVDAVETTWSSAEYIVEITSDPGRIWLEDGYTWPSTNLYPSNPIEIDFTCGYGTDGDDIPGSIIQALRILVADLYENRESYVFNATPKKLEIANSFLEQKKLWEL
jgi:uncharacterized phiE125 gp8 family phage protein